MADEHLNGISKMPENKRELYPINGRGGCNYSVEHQEALTIAIGALTSEVKTMNSNHKDIIKYLLFVVCIIALGKSALELLRETGKSAIQHTISGEHP